VTTPHPPASRLPGFALPRIERLKLDNGLRAVLVESGSVPKADVRLVLDIGDAQESLDETWLSRLVAEYLREGSATRDSDAYAQAVAALGGDLAVDSDDDTTTLRGRVLSEHAPAFVRLLAELVRTPRFPPGDLPRLRSDLERRLALAQVQPHMLALERFRAALYGDHPYGRVFPRPGLIGRFTTDAARAFYEAHGGAARATLYVAGRFDERAVGAAVAEAFDGWPAGADSTVRPPQPRHERAVHLVDRAQSEQSTIYMGLPVPAAGHEDWIPLWVANALLGGSFISRILLNLREDKGYSYSPFGFISTRRRDANWMQIADVTTEVTGASLVEIFREIDRLRAEAPPTAELEGIQRYVTGTYLTRFATPAGISEQLASLDLQGLDASYAEATVERANAVTPEEVRSVVERCLRPEEMAIVVVGDASRVAGQIEPFGRVSA